eukprot:GHVT01025170.1.p1 GENE.GHVT01025170.1~~GHVT01025170.1.p1  ORF type:complete len:119 (+),score=7.51 GHVT01025170.1:404-760(+)
MLSRPFNFKARSAPALVGASGATARLFLLRRLNLRNSTPAANYLVPALTKCRWHVGQWEDWPPAFFFFKVENMSDAILLRNLPVDRFYCDTGYPRAAVVPFTRFLCSVRTAQVDDFAV